MAFPVAQFMVSTIQQGTPLLFGSTGEIITEKSGNLNLGIPGIMYVGAISGVIGGFFYQTGTSKIIPALAILIPFGCSLLGSLLMSLIYCFLTVTLRANQNVTGLAMTTFGVGIGNFFGGSLIRISKSDVPYLSLSKIAKVYQTPLPFANTKTNNEVLKFINEVFFSYGFLVYLSIIIALTATFVLKRTRVGLHLRAVGENPATADAAGINVTGYKYFSTCIGGMTAGLGGLYFVMDYSRGIWSNNAFGDRGWMAIALVIFATWKPNIGMIGSYIFGGLYILFNYIKVPTVYIPLFKMLPYIVTIVVLVVVSIRKKRENQPPASLGLPYFREER